VDEPWYPATLQADAARLNGWKRVEKMKADPSKSSNCMLLHRYRGRQAGE